jgi:ATPase subunit of ABC transporter with duplicated ATPase domains
VVALGSIVVSELEYAPPGRASLFFDVSFTVSPGERAVLIGTNGVGKSTLLRILAGELEADAGEFALAGSVLTMTQDVGMGSPDATLRELLIEVAPTVLRDAGRTLVAAEADLAAAGERTHDDVNRAGIAYADALNEWGDLGGYELEAHWAAAVERSVTSAVDDVGTRRVGELSGGERKRLVLDVILSSRPDILLLDEPDNYLDIPTRGWLEDQLRNSGSTVLMVSHDRAVLDATATKVIALEGSGAWVHGGPYRTFPEARRHRQELLGDALERWKGEERRLFRHMKVMKQRAAVNFKNASKANAAETRWERFVAAGPPPPPVADQRVHMRLRGADSARRVIRMVDVSVGDLFLPFTDDVMFGERVGLIGPNGTGKTHLMRVLHGDPRHPVRPDHTGTVTFGPRTSVGLFTQVNDRPDFAGRTPFEIVVATEVDPAGRGDDAERAMAALGRYGLAECRTQPYETLSGGQRARLEILTLDLEGHNVLLLDEPTDNLDVDSAEELERALDRFVGTIIAVSHDRVFLRQLDRFVMIGDDGEVLGIPDYDVAMAALADPARARALPLVRSLT